MDRATRRVFAATLVVIIIVVGAVAALAGGTVPDPDAPAGDQVVGIVTSVDASGLTEVRSFDLRTDDGRDMTFRVGALENGAEFPPSHLAEHLAFATRIRVWYRTEGEEPVAFRLEDAE